MIVVVPLEVIVCALELEVNDGVPSVVVSGVRDIMMLFDVSVVDTSDDVLSFDVPVVESDVE